MKRTGGSNGSSTKHWSPTARTLFEHKRKVAALRFYRVQPIHRLAEIFRAMHGDHGAQRVVTIAEVTMYLPADTFEDFLRINGLPVFESVLRKPIHIQEAIHG